MSLLDNLETGASDFVGGVTKTLSNAEAQLLHTAQTESNQAFQIVNGTIHGPLGVAFGSNPGVFVNNVVRSRISAWTAIVNRTASRTGTSTYTVTDPKTGKPVQISALASKETPFATLVLLVALAASKHPAQFIDEAGRVASGQQQGHGVDQVHWWPSMGPPRGVNSSHAHAQGFLEGIPLPTPTDLAALATIAAAIVGIATVVIPLLISAVGFVVNLVAPKPPPPPPPSTIFGLSPIVVLAVAAAGIAIVMLLLKHKPAAGGGAAA